MKLLDRFFPDRAARLSVADLLNQLWVMDGRAVEGFLGELHQLRQQLAASGDLRAAMAAGGGEEPEALEVVDGIARLRIEGPIVKRVPSWAKAWGLRMSGAQDLQLQLQRALADGNVRGVLLVMDSPGGSIGGIQELADAIYAARSVKPVFAYASDQAASACYWLGAQASRLTANRAALLGSIGVFVVAVDASRFYESAGIKVQVIRAGDLKGAGTFGTPISDAQVAEWQAMVDGAAALFVDAVARGRGMAPEAAKALATGAVWYAAEAVGLGLADGVESLDVAHAAVCSAAAAESDDENEDETEEGGDDVDDAPPAPQRADEPISPEAAASTPTTDAPTGAEGTSDMTTPKNPPVAAATNELEQLRARNAELEREAALARQEQALTAKAGVAGEKTRRLEAAIADGRLAPALRPDAEAYAEACGPDVERFGRWLDGLSANVRSAPRGASPARPLEGGHGAPVLAGDAAVARRLGLSAETLELAANVSHYTADGKIVLLDGSVKSLGTKNVDAEA